MEERTAILEFERVRREYAVQAARGTPMSVHARYGNALGEMRRQIREARNGAKGKKLGELLVETGALDQQRLQQALDEQEQRDTGELLGEILLELGLINEETLLSALQTQANSDVAARRTDDEAIAVRESSRLTTTRAKSTVQ